ncbi:MAG: sigma-54-dependent Fis family transcriptional regulator [Pirellulales bacterium]|nr:sigma-54-dependent Fis family transcriptional regulator [Pirellulales bacterium]
MAHLLIVDDEPSICWGLAQLAATMGHTADTAGSAEQALARDGRPDAIVLDVRLPGIDGLAAMHQFFTRFPGTPVLIITAHGDLETAVRAVRNGAFDYLTKPFELPVVRQAIDRLLRHRLDRPGEEVLSRQEKPGEIVGSSPAMQEVFKRIALVAPSEACVHICGESGTGKELVARAIHRYSRRATGPFIAVNIASLSQSLAESELFGHVRGAFTGADQPRAGLLERANGGTIFLDEVADIPLSLQVKLLRALEHREVLPVGGTQPVQVDFRIVSATHRNLAECVADGRFRHDLYFRLLAFQIEIPPLRRRPEDIGPLAEHFLARSASTGGTRPHLTPEAMADLRKRPWYGNVRELRNALDHAMILAPRGRIAPEHLPSPSPATGANGLPCEEAIASRIRQWTDRELCSGTAGSDLYERFLALVEPPLLAAIMGHFQGQCAAAARRLGLHRTTLRKKLDQMGFREG